jgi:glucose/arabinose dehydrogenase
VLSDDDHDGYADAQQQTFLGALPNTQGLLFTDGFFYYQDDTRIRRLPYQVGQRTGTRVGDEVVNVTVYESPGHWPKTLDAADDGTIYVGNGGDQNETCDPSRPFHGGILKIDGSPGGTQVAKGLRNPIAVKCQRGHDNCFATELALDYSASTGGREKLIPIRAGDDWGYPCCATKDLPYSQVSPTPDCSRTVAESSSFIIGRTPFGFDFEPGFWPGLWRGRVYVALHGDNGSWTGARVVGIAINPSTGLPYPATELDGGSPATMTDFATGWDDGHFGHGRPADIAMSRDGRLFLANDTNGDIVWISPVE